jgi:hypothetical protein
LNCERIAGNLVLPISTSQIYREWGAPMSPISMVTLFGSVANWWNLSWVRKVQSRALIPVITLSVVTMALLIVVPSGATCVDYSTGQQAWVGDTSTVPDAFNQAVVGDYAYVAGTGIDIIDISDPASPTVVGGIEAVGGGVAANWPYLYSGSIESFSVFDVSDPTDPIQLASIPVSNSVSPSDVVYGSGHVFYLSNGDSRNLVCVDVTNPSQPTISSSLNLGGDGLGRVTSLL